MLIGFYDYTVILTYLSLILGVVGMALSSKGLFGVAVLCLLLCGICDAFDGMVARRKKDRTEDEKAFGIQIDSLCDAVSFGVAPALLCYHMGMDSVLGVGILTLYCLCGVIRLAFFNVLEAKRQQTESGSGKTYRGLPITSSAIVLPIYYLLRFLLSWDTFVKGLYLVMSAMGLLFVLDIPVKKPDFGKLLISNK